MKKTSWIIWVLCFLSLLMIIMLTGCNDNISGEKTNEKHTTEERTTNIASTNEGSNAKDGTNNGTNGDPDDVMKEKVLFIGDSITEGLKIYDTLPGAYVRAYLGLSSYKLEEELEYVLEIAPDRIFILVGLNDIYGQEENPQFFINYRNFIIKVKENLPDSEIFVQSIFPISKSVELENTNLSKFLINSFNIRLEKMAEEEGVVYLDVASILKDEEGYLKQEYSPDGIHLWSQYYKVWVEYLKPYMGNFKYPE